MASISHPAALNQRLVIGGPKALSYRDVGVVYERVLGRAIPVHFAAPDDHVSGLSPIAVGLLAQDQDEIVDSRALASRLGVTPTRLEELIR